MKQKDLQTERNTEKKTFGEKFGDFLRKYRTVIIVVLAVIAAAVIAIAVISQVRISQAAASAKELEKANGDYSTWYSETDVTKKAAEEKTLSASLDQIIKKWPTQYAAARALAMKATIAQQNKDWKSAEADWELISTRFSKTYLAPIAIQNAAAAAEEAGNADKSIELYNKLIKNFEGKTVGIPHAYFSLGRLSEGKKDYKAAMDNYTKVVTAYPQDDWTKLAQDRIIYLKAQGLAK